MPSLQMIATLTEEESAAFGRAMVEMLWRGGFAVPHDATLGFR